MRPAFLYWMAASLLIGIAGAALLPEWERSVTIGPCHRDRSRGSDGRASLRRCGESHGDQTCRAGDATGVRIDPHESSSRPRNIGSDPDPHLLARAHDPDLAVPAGRRPLDLWTLHDDRDRAHDRHCHHVRTWAPLRGARRTIGRIGQPNRDLDVVCVPSGGCPGTEHATVGAFQIALPEPGCPLARPTRVPGLSFTL